MQEVTIENNRKHLLYQAIGLKGANLLITSLTKAHGINIDHFGTIFFPIADNIERYSL